MDLRTVECFLAVVAEGSITGAAVQLHMSQPPLTVRLKSLEAELEVELLRRHGRGVEPTAAGRMFAERAARLLQELDATTDAVRSVGRGASGHLTIAVGSCVGPSLLARVVGQLASEAPEVSIVIADRRDTAVLDRVSHGEADVGLLHLLPSPRGVGARAVETAVAAREPLVAVMRDDHPEADSERADVQVLSSETLIVPSRASAPALYADLLKLWGDNGGDIDQIRESDSPSSTLALVQAGMGLAVMPASLADLAWQGLLARPLRQHHRAIETAIAWRTGAQSPVLQRFLRIALATPEPDVLEPGHARGGPT